jgi:hypothetical protein
MTSKVRMLMDAKMSTRWIERHMREEFANAKRAIMVYGHAGWYLSTAPHRVDFRKTMNIVSSSPHAFLRAEISDSPSTRGTNRYAISRSDPR